jgi:hypothetical protein
LKTNGANDVGFLAFHYVDEKKYSYSRLSIMLMKIKTVSGFHAPFLELGQFDLAAALRRHMAR